MESVEGVVGSFKVVLDIKLTLTSTIEDRMLRREGSK